MTQSVNIGDKAYLPHFPALEFTVTDVQENVVELTPINFTDVPAYALMDEIVLIEETNG